MTINQAIAMLQEAVARHRQRAQLRGPRPIFRQGLNTMAIYFEGLNEFYEVEYSLPGTGWTMYRQVKNISGVNGALEIAKAVSEGPMAKENPGTKVRVSKIMRSVLKEF